MTIDCFTVPRLEFSDFGVVAVEKSGHIVSFVEKPLDPPGVPGLSNQALASMGIYVFDTRFLFEQLRRDASDPKSSHDFGRDIIPFIVKNGQAVEKGGSSRPSL